jgi:hypothetical protein
MVIVACYIIIDSYLPEAIWVNIGQEGAELGCHVLIIKPIGSMNKSVSIDHEIIPYMIITLGIEWLDPVSDDCQLASIGVLSHLPSLSIVCLHGEESWLSCDTWGNEWEYVTSFGRDLVFQSNVVARVNIAIVKDLHEIATEKTRITVHGWY